MDSQSQSDRGGEAIPRSGSLKENAPTLEEAPGLNLNFTSAASMHSALQPDKDEGSKPSGSRAQDNWAYRSRGPSPRDDTSDGSFIQKRPSVTPPARKRQTKAGSDDSNKTRRENDAPSEMARKKPTSTRTSARPPLARKDSFAGELPPDIEQKRARRDMADLFKKPLSQLEDSNSFEDESEFKIPTRVGHALQSDLPSSIDQPSAYKANDEPGAQSQSQPQAQAPESDESQSQPSAYRANFLPAPDSQPHSAPAGDSQHSESELSESQRLTSSQWNRSFPDGRVC